MPRKVRKPLPPTSDALPVKPAPTLVLDAPSVPPVPEEKGQRGGARAGAGRPSAAAKAEQQAAERAAAMIRPEEMRPLTATLLLICCKLAKGDLPLEKEIDMVNPPATAVANKWSMTNKYAPELALVACVGMVVKASRERMADKRAREMPRDRSDSENVQGINVAEIMR